MSRFETLKRLYRASNLAQSLGHRDSALLNRLRDELIAWTPNTLKTTVFDALIRYADTREED